MNFGPLKYVGPWGPYFWFKDTWIVGRLAAGLFSSSAILIVVWTVESIALGRYGVRADQMFPGWKWLWTSLGVSVVLGGGFLWFGMLRYWVRLDRSARWIRRVSFFALTFGLVWGAAVYCLAVYFPQVLRKEPQGA